LAADPRVDRAVRSGRFRERCIAGETEGDEPLAIAYSRSRDDRFESIVF